MYLFRSLTLTVACAIGASGQAVVEHAIGTAAAAAASSGAQGAGQAAGGVFGSLTKVLEKSTSSSEKSSQSASRASIQTPAPTASRPKAPASRIIDSSMVVAGLTRAEIFELCGAPTSAVQRTRSGSVIETLWYKTTNGDELEVQIVDGKVASAILASEKKRGPVAVAIN